jgi:2-methylisocitrate lyase-like PEP mutase family enzyme
MPTDRRKQAEKAARFRELHHGPRLLILPNAWDVASARIFEDLGFTAIGTTSAGIAASLGYPDGQRISRSEMLEMVSRIANAVSIPVTADMEAGYGLSPDDLAATARAVIESGAIGMNLEDATGDDDRLLVEPALQARKIEAIRQMASSLGVPLVLNARTDLYHLMGAGDPATRFDRTVERLTSYRRAGADCLFVPGVRDAETIGRLARGVNGPLNVLAGPGMPPVAELQRLGVARLSVGSGPMRATLGLTRRIGRQLLDEGTYTLILEGAIPYAEVNELLRKTTA